MKPTLLLAITLLVSAETYAQLLPWPSWADQGIGVPFYSDHAHFSNTPTNRRRFAQKNRNSLRLGLHHEVVWRAESGEVALSSLKKLQPSQPNYPHWGAIDTGFAGVVSVTPRIFNSGPNWTKLRELIVVGFTSAGTSGVKKINFAHDSTPSSIAVSTYLQPISTKIGVAAIVDDKLWISDFENHAVAAYVDSDDDGIFDQLAVGPLPLPANSNDRTIWGFMKTREVVGARKELVLILSGSQRCSPVGVGAPLSFLSVDLSEPSPVATLKRVDGNLTRSIPRLYDAKGAVGGAKRLRIYHDVTAEKVEIVKMAADGSAHKLCKPFSVSSRFQDVKLFRALVDGEVIRVRVEGEIGGRTYRVLSKRPHLFPGDPTSVDLSDPQIKAVSFEGVNLSSPSTTVELRSDSNPQTTTIAASDYFISNTSLSVRRNALLAQFTRSADRVYVRLADAAGKSTTKSIYVLR